MTTPPIILCPGQGAQAVGMARAWADASPEAKQVLDTADKVLTDLPAPLSQLCFEGPEDTLNRTDVSQPAILAASIASYRGWLAQQGVAPSDMTPAATAGLSLGEYTALHLAGAISLEDALTLVALRGRAMQDAAEAVPSGMVALIGADEDSASKVCDAARGDDVLVCANFNAPGQVVISGSAAACDRAEDAAREQGLRATRLSVAGAFHSPVMAPAAERLAEALAKTTIEAPRCPVMSNVTAERHTTPDAIRQGLIDQLTSPVRWAECCVRLTEDFPTAEFHELAPGKTLAGMMRRISKPTKVTSHDTPD